MVASLLLVGLFSSSLVTRGQAGIDIERLVFKVAESVLLEMFIALGREALTVLVVEATVCEASTRFFAPLCM